MKETRFKQTEIGLIPEDWAYGNFADFLTTFTTGATPLRSIKSYYDGNIKWVSSGELNYRTIYDTIEHITESAAINTNLKTHEEGTFLMAITGLEAEGTRGKCAILGTKATTNQSCLAINSTSKMSVEYLYYYYRLNSDFLAFKYCQGSKQQSYTAEIVKKLPIYCPPKILEQKKIASALTSIDNLLLSLDKLIEKKRLIKQGTMQELLTGKKRLPGFTEKWIEKRLGELTKICTGKRNGDESRVFGKYPFFVRSQKVYRIDSFSFDGEAILVPGEGGIGDIFHYINGKFDYHQRVYKISNFNPSIIAMYVYYFMKFYFKEYALAQSVKATVESLRLPTFENFIIRYPNNVQEQKSIAKVLSSMDKEIESLEGKKAKYERIKQGMMQQLLTGKIRLIS